MLVHLCECILLKVKTMRRWADAIKVEMPKCFNLNVKERVHYFI